MFTSYNILNRKIWRRRIEHSYQNTSNCAELFNICQHFNFLKSIFIHLVSNALTNDCIGKNEFIGFPDEILLKIFRTFSDIDLLNIVQVCTRFEKYHDVDSFLKIAKKYQESEISYQIMATSYAESTLKISRQILRTIKSESNGILFNSKKLNLLKNTFWMTSWFLCILFRLN